MSKLDLPIGTTRHEVMRIFGTPRVNKIIKQSGNNLLAHGNPHVPTALVHPVDWDAILTAPDKKHVVIHEAQITGWGTAFTNTSTPSKITGLPQIYSAPEAIFQVRSMDRRVTTVDQITSDLWGLGCTLFEIRTGRQLFNPWDNKTDEYLAEVCILLGRLPDQY
jgi:hypothetical protein